MSDPVIFTKAEFLAELCRFRELFGLKTFWAKPSADRQAAIKGLMHCYFNLDPLWVLSEEGKKEGESVAKALGAALHEYTLREGLMMKHGMAVGL